jgi:uncharacterized membrane protein
VPEEQSEKKKTGILRILQREYKVGDLVPTSAIYECSVCESITAYKQGEKFSPCHDCSTPAEQQTWYRTNEFVHFVSRNVNTEFSKIETFSIRLAEAIADVAGNVWFVYFHVVWFAYWIYVNTGHEILGMSNFDPYPFGFLTMVVSLEAIFLSTFILIAQNLQSRKSEIRADLDYQVNLKTEKDVAEMLSILMDIREGRLRMADDGRVILDTSEHLQLPPQTAQKRRRRKKN